MNSHYRHEQHSYVSDQWTPSNEDPQKPVDPQYDKHL